MNGFVILNASKEIMNLELQTDYLCPGMEGGSALPTQFRPLREDLPCDSQQILQIAVWPARLYHWKLWL